MDFSILRVHLDARGWYSDPNEIRSPSGGLQFSWGSIESIGLSRFYRFAAKGRELRLRLFNDPLGAKEYAGLLRALEQSDGEVRHMRESFDEAHAIFEAWAPGHGMTLRCWELSLCSIRAQLQHPSGGISCIEWLLDEPEPTMLHLYYWEDDVARSVRRCWIPDPRMEVCRPGQLLQQLGTARERLLAPKHAAQWRISSLAALPAGWGAPDGTGR